MADLEKIEAAPIQLAQGFAWRHIASNTPAGKHDRRIGLETIKRAAKFIITGIEAPVNHEGWSFSFSCKARIPVIFAGKDFGSALSFVNTHHDAEKRAREAPSHLIAGYVPDLLAANKLECTVD